MTYIIGGMVFLAAMAIIIFITSCYKRISKTGEALIITRFGNKNQEATLSGAFVWPVVNNVERMDITRKSIAIVREGVKGKVGDEYEGLHCKDNIRANIIVNLYFGVNPVPEDVIQVAKNFTAFGASDLETLKIHFAPKFSEALKTAIKHFDFADLYTNRLGFRDKVKELLMNDMEGFKLYDVVIDKIEQTPIEAHDAQNVLDSDGIRKISEITAAKNILTAEIREKEKTEIKKSSVDGEQARLQLSRTLVESQEKTNREEEHIRIEESTKVKIRSEEARLETEKARIKTDQDIQIDEETSKREVEVTKINNDRTVEIQREHVTRAKDVEKVQTEREVVEVSLEKDKFVEKQKGEIATLVADRTATEKGIATQQELTKDIHVKSESERNKFVAIKLAEAKSEAVAVEKTTIAKADLESTRNIVEKDTLIAENKLVIATKEASGKEVLAAATRIEKAAEGLAQADVEARNTEVALLQATVTEKQGLAQAVVTEKQGLADASKVRELGLAVAQSDEAKYKAMSTIDGETRTHEINKLEIDKSKEIQLAEVEAQKVIATKNAEVMAAAMGKANIEIIGSGDMFDQIKNGLVSSKALDKRYDSSDVLQKLFGSYTDGSRDFATDLKEVLSKSEVSTGDIGNLALANLLGGLVKNNPEGVAALTSFLNKK